MAMEFPAQPSLEQLVQLIEELYSNHDSNTISEIQSYLQQIQKSNEGTTLADMLLSDQSLSLNCHFFGALTYTVVLGKLRTQENPEGVDTVAILHRLLFHTCQLIHNQRVNRSQNTFIIKKMFQNLSIIFKYDDIETPFWRDPLAALAFIISTNSVPHLETSVNIAEVLPPLLSDAGANKLILSFASTIAEDLTSDFAIRRKAKPPGETSHDRVHQTIYPTVKSILIYNIQSESDVLKISALEALASWFNYANFVHHNSQVRYNDLNDIWQCVFSLLQSSEDEVFAKCVELVTAIFEDNPYSVNYELRMKFEHMITTEWSMTIINRFMHSEDYDQLNQFALLITRYVECDELQIAMKMLSNENKPMLDFLMNLTNFPLKPIIEEQISKNLVDFWTHIVDIFTQERESIKARVHNDEQAFQQIVNNAQILFGELTKIYFNKIQLTISSDAEFKENEQEFTDFRQSVTEMFDSLFTEVGVSLFDGLTSAIASSNDLNQIETSFFLLASLSSSMDSPNDNILSSIDKMFEADFLTRVTGIIQQQPVPDFYVKYSIKFLGEIEFFYNKRDVSYVKKVIEYLFGCMQTYPSLQVHISRTILEICDSCRSRLTTSIQFLEPMLMEMITNPSVSGYTREKFSHAIACIVESIDDPEGQEEYIFHMLDVIERTAQPYLQKASQNNLNEIELEYTCSLLNCVHEIGKGLSIPDDIYGEHEASINRSRQYWTNYNGRVFVKIKSIVKTYSLDIDLLALNTDVTLTALQIYKNGLMEDFGPFAIPYSDVMEFAFQKVPRCNLQRSFQDILELMSTLLNCGLRKRAQSNRVLSDMEVSLIIKTFVADQFNLIQHDPDFLQGAVEVFTAVVSHRIGFLLREIDTMKFMVSTTLPLLLSKEKFVLKSVCKFWQKVLGSYSKTSAEEEQVLRQFIEQEIGSVLTENLMRGILDAARSDLEQYGLVMLTLVAKHQLHLKGWLTNSLERINSERVARGKHELGNRSIFIQKILVTRGSARMTNDVLKSFWQDSNGLHWNTA